MEKSYYYSITSVLRIFCIDIKVMEFCRDNFVATLYKQAKVALAS